MSLYCQDCERRTADLGRPSHARWEGPDGKSYCSMHFIQRFGHGEKLVKVADYEPPAQVKPVEEKLPSTHAGLDQLADERGIDLGDAQTVAEKQAAIEQATTVQA